MVAPAKAKPMPIDKHVNAIIRIKIKLDFQSEEGKRDQVWEYFRMWSFVSVERPEHPWYPAHIVVSSKGERVPIGDFLTEDEKEELAENLERIILELK